MWIYYCDGLQSYEASTDYQPNPEEVSFDHQASEEELIQTFPNYLSSKLERDTQLKALNRSEAYRLESDPLFFQAQRGEITMEEWLAKVNEIKARYN